MSAHHHRIVPFNDGGIGRYDGVSAIVSRACDNFFRKRGLSSASEVRQKILFGQSKKFKRPPTLPKP